MIYLNQRFSCTGGEVATVAVGFVDRLKSGELLSSVTSVAESGTSDFTISSSAVNVATIAVDGVDHIAGQALQYTVTVTGSPTLGEHKVHFEVDTDGGQTIKRGCYFDVE